MQLFIVAVMRHEHLNFVCVLFIHHHNNNRVIHSFGTLAGVKPIQHLDTHIYLAFKCEMIFELEREYNTSPRTIEVNEIHRHHNYIYMSTE